MILQNNGPKAIWAFYKINGVPFKKKLSPYSQLDISEITDASQINFNSHDEAKRNIEMNLGKTFVTDIEIIDSNTISIIGYYIKSTDYIIGNGMGVDFTASTSSFIITGNSIDTGSSSAISGGNISGGGSIGGNIALTEQLFNMGDKIILGNQTIDALNGGSYKQSPIVIITAVTLQDNGGGGFFATGSTSAPTYLIETDYSGGILQNRFQRIARLVPFSDIEYKSDIYEVGYGLDTQNVYSFINNFEEDLSNIFTSGQTIEIMDEDNNKFYGLVKSYEYIEGLKNEIETYMIQYKKENGNKLYISSCELTEYVPIVSEGSGNVSGGLGGLDLPGNVSGGLGGLDLPGNIGGGFGIDP